MTGPYSHIVVGAGALGTAAAYWLAHEGAERVLVLEQFELGHTKGASEDHSRIIRHAYHSSVYSDLTRPAYAAWEQIEQRTGLQLVLRTGGLDLATLGTSAEATLDNYRRSLRSIGVSWEDLDASEIRSRWPQWALEDNVVGLYQEDGGLLDIRRANAAHIALARQHGVTFTPNTVVTGLHSDRDGVTLKTSQGDYRADAVVLCAASWLERLLPDLGLEWKITLSQEQVSFFATPNVQDFSPNNFPTWIWHGEPDHYGFPVYGEVAVKLGRDMSGQFVTQESRSFHPDSAVTRLLADFLRVHLPRAIGPELYSRTCVYDMPPDRNFILDYVPEHPRIVVGLGAGHAAKFASLLGQIMADLSLHGRTTHPIEAFRATRPALADATFAPAFRLKG